ncbi:MAG: hypothetical protein IPI49_22435 [Myxococcales bacterium]|nr:hypothetical protein [Myxococcales bacterium]
MVVAIFGPDTPYLVADLREYALVAPRQDRLELPPPMRWYAEHKLETTVPRERQLELLERTLGALEAFMAACYKQLGKPGADAVIAASLREEANLAALVERFERLHAAAPNRSSLSGPRGNALEPGAHPRRHLGGGHCAGCARA